MSERRRFYAVIDAEVSDNVERVADDLRDWITARRASGRLGPEPTTVVTSVDPPIERRRGQKRWNSAYRSRSTDEGDE